MVVEFESALEEGEDAAAADLFAVGHLPGLVGWAGVQFAAGEAFELSLAGVIEGEWGCYVFCCWFVSC